MGKPASMRRPVPVVQDLWLLALLLILAAIILMVYSMVGTGERGGLRPGDTSGHFLGIAGALLMVASAMYPLVKRTTRLSALKPWWHQGHLLLGPAGAALVFLHLSARLGKAPALIALAVVGLVVLGGYGRLLAGRLVHKTFASDTHVFLPVAAGQGTSLQELISRKQRQLDCLSPSATEGVFTLSLAQWFRHPVNSARYALLALRETQMVGQMGDGASGPVVLLQRNWRLLHLLLVALMVVGVVAHTVAVLFFAGYVSEGSEPYWWYLRK